MEGITHKTNYNSNNQILTVYNGTVTISRHVKVRKARNYP